jgi:hypothetical protein
LRRSSSAIDAAPAPRASALFAVVEAGEVDVDRTGPAVRLAVATQPLYHSSGALSKTVLRRGPAVREIPIGWSAVALVVLVSALSGCGRRATELDCQLIVDKSVELQLRDTNQTSPEAIEKREEQVRAELQDEIKACEGRRVTDKTMECVHAAPTTQELEKCLQ